MNFQGNAWNLGYVGCGSYTNVVRQNRTWTVLWQGWMSSAARVIPAMCWLPFPRIGGRSVCLLMGSKSLWVEQVRDLFSQVPELKRQLPDLFIVLPAYVTPFLYVQIIEWRMFAFCGMTCLWGRQDIRWCHSTSISRLYTCLMLWKKRFKPSSRPSLRLISIIFRHEWLLHQCFKSVSKCGHMLQP